MCTIDKYRHKQAIAEKRKSRGREGKKAKRKYTYMKIVLNVIFMFYAKKNSYQNFIIMIAVECISMK